MQKKVMVSYNWTSEASPTMGCSIESSRDIYVCCRYVVCRMSVVSQINCVSGITYDPRACSKSFFLAVKPVSPPCYSFPIRLSFSMDEKEAEARPVMGTIFLVLVLIYTLCCTFLHTVIVKCNTCL